MNPVLVDIKEIEAFLIQEADYLDRKQFQDWLHLFAEDAIYWVPSNQDDYDPMVHVSIIYDNMERLKERVWRLESGLAYGQEPQSKTNHLLTNVRILDNLNDRIKVAANFIVVEIRRSVKTIYSGRMEYELIQSGLSWKIAQKKTILLENDEYIGNFSFLI
ncbi:aromatic-ring-hydroxylating dioxygenase subunit beta [Niallia sp. Krafla_26]|uniref:aromatic-ring-hydroxylating dioxygenase subunit beta n=1 Tax=Niallia sp. Krafla_26 TaxID=3064703 RepID=UPI003D17DCE8